MESNQLITLALILVKKMNAPPPAGKFKGPEQMVETIKRFVQDNGYDICIRRSEKGKKNIFKCDRYDLLFSILFLFFLYIFLDSSLAWRSQFSVLELKDPLLFPSPILLNTWRQVASPEALKWKDKYASCFELTAQLKDGNKRCFY
ncbi:hypothetical protein VP01_5416g2 [Puccinia sorghi]|uniref:Uncharacterized protein n=1 Tax=Puccinia sorghi TaxID=27349 RepID=A0A0L6UKI0_9BASI|nr:hypothetical protein VP01_5416g2 [Puccinia sorghi]